MWCGAWRHAAAPTSPIAFSLFVLRNGVLPFVNSPRAPYKNARSGKPRPVGGVMRVLQRTWPALFVLAVASSWAAAQTTVYVDDDDSDTPCPGGSGTSDHPYC